MTCDVEEVDGYFLSLSRALSRVAQAIGRGHGGKPPGASREHTVAPVSSRGTICEPVSHLHGGMQVFSRSPDLDLLDCVCDGGREEIGA
jgi:hypothetical protein